MNGSYGQYLRAMMPFISSAPTSPPEQEPNPTPDIDPAQSEVVFRSYHHCLGRPPTLDEWKWPSATVAISHCLPSCADRSFT